MRTWCWWLALAGCVAYAEPTVVFLGDSLTAGYGVGPDVAFPALIDQQLDEQKAPARIINAGVSGETSAGGRSRIDWLLKQKVDVLVLALGANDGLRGINPAATETNLAAIIERAREKRPAIQILLTGMKVPPNMGDAFAASFEGIFPRLAERYQLPLVGFLLEGVGGIAEMNLQDGIHPNEAGHQQIASLILPKLLPLVANAPGNE